MVVQKLITIFVSNKQTMNGLTRILMGVAWFIIGLYGTTVINPNYNTAQVVACGFLIALIFIGGVIFVGTGVSKMQKGQ